MCLTKVEPAGPKKRSGVGYKVLEQRFDYKASWSSGKTRRFWTFVYYPLKDISRVVFRKWLTAEECPLMSGYGTEYISGFHIYTKLSDARFAVRAFLPTRRIVKVQYKGAHTDGIQGTANVIVAKQVKFLKLIPNAKEKK